MFRTFFNKFRKKREADTHLLVLDIGTEFVKALICRVEGGHGFVMGYGKVRQAWGNMTAGAVTDIAAVTNVCEQALHAAAKMAGVLPEQTILGIAGELVTGKTATITYTRPDPRARIDLDELKAIVARVQQKAFADMRQFISTHTGVAEVDVKLVHAAIIGTEIDTRPVSSPIGFQGTEVSMSVFNAFAPLVHFGALQTIAAELDLDTLAILAEPYAVSRALEGEASGGESAIYIDVGGGTTDIAVVQGQSLKLHMFAIGGRTFTKRIAQSFQISHHTAEQMKLDYAQNKLPEKETAAVRKALATDTDVWLAGVELALCEMAGKSELPSRVYLCGGGARLPELKTALESAEFSESIPISGRLSVRFLVPDDFGNFTDETGLLRSVQDTTPLALASAGMQLMGSESVTDSLLRKAVQLLSR